MVGDAQSHSQYCFWISPWCSTRDRTRPPVCKVCSQPVEFSLWLFHCGFFPLLTTLHVRTLLINFLTCFWLNLSSIELWYPLESHTIIIYWKHSTIPIWKLSRALYWLLCKPQVLKETLLYLVWVYTFQIFFLFCWLYTGIY